MAVCIGVPAVLVGYIVLTEVFLRLFPERLKPRIRPWLWLAPALLFLFVFLVYPTIGTIIRSFQNQTGTNVRRPRQLRLVLHQQLDADLAQEQRAVGRS